MAATEPSSSPRAQASISVIVPSYNGGQWLAESLDSILAQTLPVKQIVVVDDGSTDNTAEVMGRYSGPRIQYIRKQHGGMASTRNAGLDAARGEFITFLHAGDRWSPTFLERMHDYLVADAAASCVFSNFVHVEPSTGKMLGEQFQNYPGIKRPTLLRDAPAAHGRIPKDRAFGALVTCGDVPDYMQVMMFRRSAIGSMRFQPELGRGADTAFALNAFMQGMVIFTDEVLALVRKHDDAASNDQASPAVQTLNGLKAIGPNVTRDSDVRAYQERLIEAHLAAALAQFKAGQVRGGFRTYRGAFQFPGWGLRKAQGSLRLLAALPQAITK